MEVPDVGSQQYVGYKTDGNNKMFNWIQNGSKIDELKCSSKSEFDKNSRIEKLTFNESDGHCLTVLFEDDVLKTHIKDRIEH